MKLFILTIFLCEIMIHFETVSSSELRFCYKGWQRFRKTDCPYGLVFKTPVDLECYFSIGEETPKLVPYY